MRPTDLTPEMGAKLIELVAQGLPLSKAAEHEGITYRTLCRWMKRTDEPYATFCHSLKGAKAAAQLPMIRDIREGVNNWQARAWYLERSDPKNWGRKDKLDATVRKPDPDEVARMTTEEKIAAHEKAILELREQKEARH